MVAYDSIDDAVDKIEISPLLQPFTVLHREFTKYPAVVLCLAGLANRDSGPCNTRYNISLIVADGTYSAYGTV